MAIDANGEGNVIAGNRIEGHPDGIFIGVPPGTSFRHNVIRDNTIIVQRVPFPPTGVRPHIVDVTDESDSTIVGIPLAIYPVEGPPGSPDVETAEGTFDDNLIEGNRLIGAEGVAIAIRRGARNRIVGNTITGIRRREPFPGNTRGQRLRHLALARQQRKRDRRQQLRGHCRQRRRDRGRQQSGGAAERRRHGARPRGRATA
jgi:hypothetical protein